MTTKGPTVLNPLLIIFFVNNLAFIFYFFVWFTCRRRESMVQLTAWPALRQYLQLHSGKWSEEQSSPGLDCKILRTEPSKEQWPIHTKIMNGESIISSVTLLQYTNILDFRKTFFCRDTRPLYLPLSSKVLLHIKHQSPLPVWYSLSLSSTWKRRNTTNCCTFNSLEIIIRIYIR